LRSNFPLVMAHVKSSCENSTKAVVDELQSRFPHHELMLTLGRIHPNFWAQNLDNLMILIDVGLLSMLLNITHVRLEKMRCDWKLSLMVIFWIHNALSLSWQWLQTMYHFWKSFLMSTSCLDCGPRLVLLRL
jgi:hypothetical protein